MQGHDVYDHAESRDSNVEELLFLATNTTLQYT